MNAVNEDKEHGTLDSQLHERICSVFTSKQQPTISSQLPEFLELDVDGIFRGLLETKDIGLLYYAA